MPKQSVSVIIPFFNAERFLEQAIESVLAQTFHDWELLLVDDGSHDRGTALAASYAERFPEKVRVIVHDGHANRGLSEARNLGFKHARARYMAFLDADDVWVENKLAEQVAILEAIPEVAMVFGDTRLWRSWTSGGVHAEHDVIYGPCQEKNRIYYPASLVTALYPLGKGKPPSMSGLMVRSNVVEAIGRFENRFSMYEDQAFLVKIYLSFPVYAADACWDYYRQHPHSIVAKAHSRGQYWAVRGQFLSWLGGFLQKSDVADPAVMRAFAKANWYFQHPILGPLLAEATSVAKRPIGRIQWRLLWLLRLALMRCLSPRWFRRAWVHLTLRRHCRRVLATIALRQPIKQLEIESILLGDVTETINSLMALGMIDLAVGSIPLGGGPDFVTTPQFLEFQRIEDPGTLSQGFGTHDDGISKSDQ